MRSWVKTAAGFVVGAIVATGGMAFAQGYLGQSTLVVNGTTYSGAFTPQESASDVLVPVSQLAGAMGFQYAWSNNTLSITTNGTTPATTTTTGGSSNPPATNNYPITISVATPNGASSSISPPSDLDGTVTTVNSNNDPAAEVKVKFLYHGKPRNFANQRVSVAVSGTPQNYEIFDGNCALFSDGCTDAYADMSPTGNGDYVLPKDAFSGGADALYIFSSDTGPLTLTFTDLSNSHVAPVSETVNFTN